MRISLTNAAQVQGVLNGHEMRFYKVLGMACSKVCHEVRAHSGLQDSKHLAEWEAVLFRTSRAGGSHRAAREWFQHASDTDLTYVRVYS